jgi:hypothetical protein
VVTAKSGKMATDKIKLVTPNSLPIVGIRLNDGTISKFEFTYNKTSKTMMYILPSGNTEKIATNNGAHILVDSDGKEWDSTDIEYHSLLSN